MKTYPVIVGEKRSDVRVWKSAIAVATLVVTLVGCALAFVGPAYDGRLARDAARTPAFVDEDSATSAVARWHWRTENMDFQYIDVMTFGAIDPTAPPPPGLAAWPDPGEVWMSPAALAAAGAQQFARRYGEVAGVIGTDTLADPGERIAYVGARAEDMDPDRSYPIAGFGVAPAEGDMGYFGTALYQQERRGFYVGLVLFGVVPGLALSIIAIRLDRERRARRILMTRIMGARPSTVRGAVLRQVLVPSLVGATTGVVLALAATLTTWWLPGMHYAIVGSDLASARGAVPAIGLAAVGWSTVVAAVTYRARREPMTGARPLPRVARARRWPLVALCAIVVVTNYGYSAYYAVDPAVSTLIGILGAALSLTLVGSLVATLLRAAADVMLRRARRVGNPVALVASRDLGSASRPVVRATSSIALVAVLTIQVAVWTSKADATYLDARETIAANAGLTIHVAGMPDSPGLTQIDSELPHGIAVLGVGADGAPIGPCEDLVATFGHCDGEASSPRIAPAAHWFPPDTELQAVDTVADLPDAGAESLVLVSTTGTALDPDDIALIVNRTSLPALGVEFPGESFMVGGLIYSDQGRWFPAGGVIGLGIVVILGAYTLYFEVWRQVRRLGPLSPFIGSRGVWLRLAVCMLAVPLVGAAIAGLLLGSALVVAPTLPGMPGQFPTTAVLVMLVCSVLVATAGSIGAGIAWSRTSKNWRTGLDADS